MSVSLEKKKPKHDYYGFSKDEEYKRKPDYPIIKNKSSTKKTVFFVLAITLIIIWVSAAGVSGYHAWNEFPDSSLWVKLIRVYVAIVFAPIYLFYIFVKTTVFKQM